MNEWLTTEGLWNLLSEFQFKTAMKLFSQRHFLFFNLESGQSNEWFMLDLIEPNVCDKTYRINQDNLMLARIVIVNQDRNYFSRGIFYFSNLESGQSNEWCVLKNKMCESLKNPKTYFRIIFFRHFQIHQNKNKIDKMSNPYKVPKSGTRSKK